MIGCTLLAHVQRTLTNAAYAQTKQCIWPPMIRRNINTSMCQCNCIKHRSSKNYDPWRAWGKKKPLIHSDCLKAGNWDNMARSNSIAPFTWIERRMRQLGSLTSLPSMHGEICLWRLLHQDPHLSIFMHLPKKTNVESFRWAKLVELLLPAS